MLFRFLIFVANMAVITLAKETVNDGDWSCEIDREALCPGSGYSVRRVDWKVPSINFNANISCTNVYKRGSSTFLSPVMTTYNDKTTVRIVCSDTLTPCLTSFNVCLSDYKVPNVTLSCKYLGEFEENEDDDPSTDSLIPKCGENATEHAMLSIDTGYAVTKFIFNCEEIYFEQPTRETEPDWRK